MIKIDGHTHTELCPHGTGEKTSLMIERAIRLGFTEYHLTEHAPLPVGFLANYAGDPENVKTASLSWDQLDDYFALGRRLQRKYHDRIKITVGFEVDYLEDYEEDIRAFLQKVAPQTANNIISVHYLKDSAGGYYGIDYSPAELKAGFGDELTDVQQLYQRYFRAVLASVQADWGAKAIAKIGHMSLIKKYQDYFGLPTDFSQINMNLVGQILEVAQQKKLKLDFNSAGLYKPYCNDLYPGRQIIAQARQLGIPFEFGSDAHGVSEVGRGYHLFEYLDKN